MKLDKRYALQIVSSCCGDLVVDSRRKVARVMPLRTFIAEHLSESQAMQAAFKYAWERGAIDASRYNSLKVWRLANTVEPDEREASSETNSEARPGSGEVAQLGGEGGIYHSGSGKSDKAPKKARVK